MIVLTWVSVGAGRLALRGRPGLKAVPHLREAGCDGVVTLLSEREGARDLGQAIEGAGLEWTWLPLENGQPPKAEKKAMLLAAFLDLSDRLDQGASILIHCAAGIHRTGMVAYGLLRWRGSTEEEALEVVGRLRSHTREGLQRKHIEWGNEAVAAAVIAGDSSTSG